VCPGKNLIILAISSLDFRTFASMISTPVYVDFIILESALAIFATIVITARKGRDPDPISKIFMPARILRKNSINCNGVGDILNP
jgi:hypothetical protein